MRITEDEYKAVQDAPDPQPLSGGAWPAAQGGGIVRGQSDNLGHYWDSASQAWRNENDNSLYDSSYSSGLTGGAWPAAQTSTGLGNAPQYDQPSVAQDNAYNQSQYQYTGDYGGSSVYTDPASGNVWNNGLWYDNSGNVWSNEANSWLSPAQYNDFAQQSYDYSNAQANPQFQPNTYQQPGGDWYNYDNQQPQNYNLVNPQLDERITSQPQPDWLGRFGGASGGTSALDKLGTLGSDALTALQAPQQYVGGPIAQAAWENPGAALSFAANPIGGIQSLALGAATNPQGAADTYQSAYQANQDVLNNPDMNPFLKETYRTLTDPLSYVGPAAAAKLIPGEGAVPSLLRGAVDQGGLGMVLGGNLGGVAATTKAAENIPYFGDQPALLRGLEGAVVGGLAGGGIQSTLQNTLAHGTLTNPLTNDTGEAFSTGIRKNTPERTVIPQSDRVFKPVQPDQVRVEYWNPDDSGLLRGSLAAADHPDTAFSFYQDASGRFNVQGVGWFDTLDEARTGAAKAISYVAVRTGDNPQPLANDRLWFHSTRDMKYDLPDPDAAVGTQTGITQGPGVYMAADPAKSAGNYGNRTFVTEFDGNKVLDLTKQMTPDTPVFAGGPSWNKIRDDLAAKFGQTDRPPVTDFDTPQFLVKQATGDGGRPLDAGSIWRVPAGNGTSHTVTGLGGGKFRVDLANGMTHETRSRAEVLQIINGADAGIIHAFDGLDQSMYRARADLANMTADTANGYVYKQALIDAVQGAGSKDELTGMLGRFSGLSDSSYRNVAHAVVQNHLADEGVDALFHHSPRADGDVLIVLNGKAARVVADVKNAPDAVKAGATLRDIKRGAVAKVVSGTAARGEVIDHPLGKQGEWWVTDPAGVQKGRITAGLLPEDGFAVYIDGKGYTGTYDTLALAKKAALDELPKDNALMHPAIRSFGSKINDESGSASLSGIAQGAKDVAGFAAPIATRTALGAGVGAAYGEASGMGWEKGAAIGAGVGAGFGVLGKVAGAAASRGVEARLAKNAPPEAAGKLTALVKAAKPIRENQEALYSAERGRRAAIGSSILAKGTDARTAFQKAKSSLAGELPKTQDFAAVEHQLTSTDIGSLYSHLRDSNLQFYTKVNAENALTKVLTGQLPTRSEITLLGKVYGDDFAKALLDKRGLKAKVWENTVDALNVPRTLMTSWDASAPLRQGAILFAGHPIEGLKATGTMIRAMASPKYADLVKQGIENSPNATTYEKMGLYFADTTHTAALSAREEAIMSRLAGKIPGVGGSQRGYTTFLNKLRQNVADNFIEGHPNLSNQELKDFGHAINIMTGRGDLPRFLSDNSAILNAAFAPRYAMSRLQLPVEMVKAVLPSGLGGTTGAASKELARDVIAFAGTGTAILTLGKLAGIWNVELDPRSTDFGKGKMGNTRFDFWAGEQQIARYAAQLIGDPTRGRDAFTTGQRKTSTGQIVDANRLDTIGRWLQTKKSPAVGFATDLLQGKDFVGNPIDLQSKEGIGTQAWQRLAPLFLQDMADAAKLSGNQWKAATALPSAFGAGVQTYEDSDQLKRKKYIQDQPNLSYAGGDYYKLNKEDRLKVDDAVGKIAPFNPQVKGAVDLATTNQSQADAKLQDKGLTYDNARVWRDSYNENKSNLRFLKEVVYQNAGTNPGSDPILDGYYKTIDGAVDKYGDVNWQKVDAYTNALPANDQQYIKDHTGFLQIDTPITRAHDTAVQSIEKSGYFDRTDQSWQQVKNALGLPYATYDEWVNAKTQEYRQALGVTKDDPLANAEIQKAIAKLPEAKAMDSITSAWREQWVINNPGAAYQAWVWGYYNPPDKIKKFLTAQVGAK